LNACPKVDEGQIVVTFTTRFAPSPTGPLHLGHAYSALLAQDMAQATSGQLLLRIEDTDVTRCRLKWEQQIYDDLDWLGLRWQHPVRRQSEHLDHYDQSLITLAEQGVIYPCSCSRSDIRAALSAPQEGASLPVGIYPGTCRHRSLNSRQTGDALRLNMARALQQLKPIRFTERGPQHAGEHQLAPSRMIAEIGDAVLARKENGTVSYAMAAVVDDADQQITHVIRGEDLYQITFLQVVLQALLNLPTPTYHHHILIRDETGKRLAKRDDARAISRFRDEGVTPQGIRNLIGLGKSG